MKYVLSCLVALIISQAQAKEGMWIPSLIGEMNIGEMQAMGFALTAEDIYSVNNSSIKDAIVHFGGGCTAEVISDKGLILTNHHCGYGQIQSHSSVDHDYLTDGFWAMKQSEELACPGLTATFIIRIEDITAKVLAGTDTISNAELRKKRVSENMAAAEKAAVTGTHYEAYTRPFYYGNQYYLFVTETFKDIRMVGAPPSAIGKFGGDTDNWVWPRHTGDFSIFRIYANKDNKPAAYAADNVPFVPRHSLPISLKGVKQNDFTMVYGFPGRTQEYLTSNAVDYVLNKSNPIKIKMRENGLSVMDGYMKQDAATRIQYAAKYARIANYWKKWIGESKGLTKYDAIQKKQSIEKELITKASTQNAKDGAAITALLDSFKLVYANYNTIALDYEVFAEFYYSGPELFKFINALLAKAVPLTKKDIKPEEVEAIKKKMVASIERFYKDFNVKVDKDVMTVLAPIWFETISTTGKSTYVTALLGKHQNNWSMVADAVYSKSLFADKDQLIKFINDLKPGLVFSKIKDPAFVLADDLAKTFDQALRPKYVEINQKVTEMQAAYMTYLMKYTTEKKFYPDANSTLRVTYGKVDGYKPADGVSYNCFSTIEGIMEKDGTADDFVVPLRLKELYDAKDYGQYAEGNTLPVCFIASNHTTGGNSGSPAIDANGNLIGLNFDRCWEGTMSDIFYDAEICRNIMVDMRYVLFVVDKYAGAGYLVDEMKLIR